MMVRATVGMVVLGLVTMTVAADAQSGGHLLVAEKTSQSIKIVDPAAGKVIAAVREGEPQGKDTGHEVAASLDGKFAYAPVYGDSGVGKPGTDGRNMVVIDIASHKLVGNVDFGHGVRPHCAVVAPPMAGFPEGVLYVTTELDKTVSIIDPKTLKIVGTVPTGSEESHMLAITHDGRWGYTANVGPGTVSVLDLKARKVVKIIPIAKTTQRISVSMDDKMAFTSDQTKPELDVIDTATNTVKARVPLASYGYGTASTPDGRWLLVPMMDVNKVAVVDLKTLTVAKNIDLAAGTHPQEALVRPDGKAAYVSCDHSGQVAEIDPATWTVRRMIDTGKVSDGLAWAK
jgi:YVTN family beta-propeller protein